MPRLIGMEFGQFFLLLYAISYALAPFVVWSTASLWRAIPRRRRRIAGAVMLLLIAAPMWGVMTWHEGALVAAKFVLGTACFWLFQVCCIGLVYLLFFRPRPGFAEVLRERVEARRRRREVRD